MSKGLSMQSVWDLLDDVSDKIGYHTALRGSLCCQSCSLAALEEEMTDEPFALYFHEQDVASVLGGSDKLAIRHCPKDDYATKDEWRDLANKFIEMAGDCVTWNGDPGTIMYLKVDPDDWEWRDNFYDNDDDEGGEE